MNPEDTPRLLAMAAARDNRKPSQPMAWAWYQDLGDLDFDLAVEAMNRHFRTSTEYLMPVHIRALAADIDHERRQAQREAREAIQAEQERRALDSRPLVDRSDDVNRAVAVLAAKLSTIESPDAARERALLRARHERGRPEPTRLPKQRRQTSRDPYPPPCDGRVAALARQYLADGWSPDQLSARLGIARKWLRRAAADKQSLPPPTHAKEQS